MTFNKKTTIYIVINILPALGTSPFLTKALFKYLSEEKWFVNALFTFFITGWLKHFCKFANQWLYLSFAHFFQILSILLIDFCDCNNFVPLNFIAINHKNSVGKRKFLRYSGWQRVVMAKCQGKGRRKKEFLYCCVSPWWGLSQRLKFIKPLFKNTQLWCPM